MDLNDVCMTKFSSLLWTSVISLISRKICLLFCFHLKALLHLAPILEKKVFFLDLKATLDAQMRQYAKILIEKVQCWRRHFFGCATVIKWAIIA